MRPHQGQAELMDLVKELLEPFVLGDPCAHLGEQVLGDVDGAGLVAGALEGEVLALVPGPPWWQRQAGRPQRWV